MSTETSNAGARLMLIVFALLSLTGCLSPSLRAKEYQRWRSRAIEYRRGVEKEPFPDRVRDLR
ncbi:MAG: hypothetical protein ACHP9S_04435 [Terriglobales bacterium]|jgi:hypothetical protein